MRLSTLLVSLSVAAGQTDDVLDDIADIPDADLNTTNLGSIVDDIVNDLLVSTLPTAAPTTAAPTAEPTGAPTSAPTEPATPAPTSAPTSYPTKYSQLAPHVGEIDSYTATTNFDLVLTGMPMNAVQLAKVSFSFLNLLSLKPNLKTPATVAQQAIISPSAATGCAF